MKKKLLSIMVAVLMILSVMSVNVFAAEGAVAAIGEAEYTTLAEAIANVTNGDTIKLLADCDEDVTIKQEKNVSFTIDGDGKTYTGTIYVNGNKRSTGAETLTIKNVNFVMGGTYGIAAHTTKNTYPHNITVEDCSFTGTGSTYKQCYAIYLRHAYNITLKNVEATGVYDLVYGHNAVTGFTAENVTVTDSGMGFMLPYATGDILFKNVTIEASGAGVGLYNNAAFDAVFENCSIEADPAIVYEAKTNRAATITINDTNELVPTEDGLLVQVRGDDANLTNTTVVCDLTRDTVEIDGNIYSTQVSVSFDANGGEAVADQTVTFDTPYGELPVTVRTGYTFNGWFDAEGNEVTAETIVETIASHTLTAAWTANNYTVSFDANGGEAVADQTVTFDAAYGELPVAVRTGYTFSGWFDAEGNEVTAETTVKTASDHKLTASWTANVYNITYVLDDGTIYDGPVDTYTYGVGAKLPSRVVKVGYAFEGWYDNANFTGTKVTVITATDLGDKTFYAKWRYNVPAAGPAPKAECPCDNTCPMYSFADLNMTLWYHDGIHFALETGLMNGTGANAFEPNKATTRAMIVTMLWRLEGEPAVSYNMTFEDVAAGQWYTEAIRWAASKGIVEGYSEAKFGPSDVITREQLATIMWRYAKAKGYDVSVGENTNILSYDDAFTISSWAIPAMQWACGEGLIQGISNGTTMNLAHGDSATRAQAAAILQRFCENVVNN